MNSFKMMLGSHFILLSVAARVVAAQSLVDRKRLESATWSYVNNTIPLRGDPT